MHKENELLIKECRNKVNRQCNIPIVNDIREENFIMPKIYLALYPKIYRKEYIPSTRS